MNDILSFPKKGNHPKQAYISFIQYKNLTPCKFVADSSQKTSSKLNLKFLKLIPVPT